MSLALGSSTGPMEVTTLARQGVEPRVPVVFQALRALPAPLAAVVEAGAVVPREAEGMVVTVARGMNGPPQALVVVVAGVGVLRLPGTLVVGSASVGLGAFMAAAAVGPSARPVRPVPRAS